MKTLRVLVIAAIGAIVALGQPAPEHGKSYKRLMIRNAIVIEGNGTPAAGPRDIVVEGNKITSVTGARASAGVVADAVIDAKGKYVTPGFINMHGHTHDERGGVPMDVHYVLKLWLACGITTVRDVGSDFEKTKKIRDGSREGKVEAPRLFLYPFFGRPRDAEAAVARVRQLKQQGADGIKIVGIHRDTMDAMMDEAHKLGLPVAHHVGVEETNAWDNIHNRTTTIEHWYGIPDAAIPDGVQNFPASYNYNDEVDRFRYAGRLWREADPKLLTKVLQGMVDAGVGWDPTLNIYEASRDLQRAQTQPQFAEYLHPVLARFFEPSRDNHGSYFFNWTTTDEVFWKENYRIWMNAVREYARLGGIVTTGEDAGYIYQMYGFGYLRELELQQEAGFHPLKVLQHATLNGAYMLGQDLRLGRVRAGWTADLLVLNINPLENLKGLSPMTGGIQYTIKDGIVYDSPRLFGEVKKMVAAAKGQEKAKVSGQ